jgi:hypothetical protein
LPAGGHSRSLDQDPEPFRDRPEADIIHVADRERELLAPEPGDAIGRPRGFEQGPRHRAQCDVAGRVPAHVIDQLEPVDVRDEQPEAAAVARELGDSRDHRHLEMASVRDAGERIVHGQVAQLRDLAPDGGELGALVEDLDRTDHRALAIPHGGRANPDRDPVAFAMAQEDVGLAQHAVAHGRR